MALGRITLLSDDELKRIHETSLNILEKVGVQVYSEEAQTLLVENGAELNSAHSIVKIPSSLVEEAIKKAPKEIVLYGREPKFDLKLPSKDITFVAPNGTPIFIRDIETGERRSARTSDLKDFAVLCDYLDQIDLFWSPVLPTDVPPPLQHAYSFVIPIEHTSKHVQQGALSREEAKLQIEIASAIVGDKEKLKKKPIISSVHCTVSPLVFEKDCTEAMVEFARAGIPVLPYSMPMCAITAPATIAGTLTILNAENLAALTIIQCANPGAPMIYGGESSSADMRTAEFNCRCPEYPLLTAGITQMARFYNFPVYAGGCGLDESPDDWKTLIEGSRQMALMHLSRADISAGLGSVENSKCSALEQVILDAEAWIQARAYLRTFDVNEDTLGFDVISKVGPGGTFLTQKHTLQHFRREIWLKKEPTILPSTSGSLIEAAKKKVKEILSTHVPSPLPEDVKKEIEQILQQYKKNVRARSHETQ